MEKLSDIEKENFAQKALKNEKALWEMIDNLSKKCDKRWPSFKILNYMSEKYPEALYLKWDYITDLFRTGNSYTKYATIYILANLTKVDKKNKFKKLFDDYFGEIDSNRTVTAAQVVYNARKIAKAKPELQDNIIKKIMDIENTHKGKQKGLIEGYAIDAFYEYYQDFTNKKK